MAAIDTTDIRVLINDTWIPALPEHQQQYLNFLDKPYKYEDKYIIRANNSTYGETYLKESNNIIPICDWNNVQVFLPELGLETCWVNARNYQTWAFFFFVYKKYTRIHFASKNSQVNWNNYVMIPIDGLAPNIIFSISRNDNYSVYYEKDDIHQTRVRICDYKYARDGFQGFYNRVFGESYYDSPVTNISSNIFDISKVINQKTNIEEEQCMICFDNKKNIKYSPCGHDMTCAACHIRANRSTCAFCTRAITSISML